MRDATLSQPAQPYRSVQWADRSTCAAVADDGVDKLVNVHQSNGNVARLTRHGVNHFLADGAQQNVAWHIARRTENHRIAHGIHCAQ